MNVREVAEIVVNGGDNRASRQAWKEHGENRMVAATVKRLRDEKERRLTASHGLISGELARGTEGFNKQARARGWIL